MLARGHVPPPSGAWLARPMACACARGRRQGSVLGAVVSLTQQVFVFLPKDGLPPLPGTELHAVLFTQPAGEARGAH